MALSDADREWLTDQFNTVHTRINEETAARVAEERRVGSSIYNLKAEVQAGVYGSAQAIANAMSAHKGEAHDIRKHMGFIGLLIGICMGAAELIKFLFHIGKDSR